MSREVNFVQHRRKKLTKQQANDKKIFFISLTAFGVFLVFSAIVVIVFLVLEFRVARILKQQKQVETKISGLEEKERSITITKAKLVELTKLFEQRFDKQATITFFSDLLGPEILIKDINYEAEGEILSLRTESPSVFALERVFNQLAKDEVSQNYGLVNKSSLTRNNSGVYNMNITISLKREDGKPKTKK